MKVKDVCMVGESSRKMDSLHWQLYMFKNVCYLCLNIKIYLKKKTVTTYTTRTTSLKYPQYRLSKTEEGPEYACVTFYNKLTPQIRAIQDKTPIQ
ncbi:hypothetical protein HHI36_010189, partial [Cryptolaemus montrouzieri]